MLFMGEEYGEPAPFQYFIGHGDPTLVEAVREGRTRGVRGLRLGATTCPTRRPRRRSARSKLDWSRVERPPHAQLSRCIAS